MAVLPCLLAQIWNRSCKSTFKYTDTLKYVQYVGGKRERMNEKEIDRKGILHKDKYGSWLKTK